MKRIAINSLNIGDVFPESLFLSSGQKLVPADTAVTERHLQLLRNQSASYVVQANTYTPEVVSQAGSRAGTKSSVDRDRLRQRKKRVEECDAIVERLTHRIDERVLRVRPKSAEVWDTHPPRDAEWPCAEGLHAMRAKGVKLLEGIHDRLDGGQRVAVAELDLILNDMLTLMLGHRERFAQLAMCVNRDDDYLADHAYASCVFAMAIAGQLAWGIEDIKRVGQAALLYDVGMLVVPERIRSSGEQLTDLDRGRIQRHTAYTVAVLDGMGDLSEAVRLAAYQHHERENGTGYPRGLKDVQIGDYGRVIAVADVYAAMSSPRNYRKNRLPYAAMEQLVRSAGTNQYYKPAVRALVQMTGLFPVGSYVELSSGAMARVEAANPNHLDRPIVQPITSDGQAKGGVVDLKRIGKDELAVTRPLETPESLLPAA